MSLVQGDTLHVPESCKEKREAVWRQEPLDLSDWDKSDDKGYKKLDQKDHIGFLVNQTVKACSLNLLALQVYGASLRCIFTLAVGVAALPA